jgi:tRNA-Thr(GGU) m(6)t(6)A37 methyltransferase TsaA
MRSRQNYHRLETSPKSRGREIRVSNFEIRPIGRVESTLRDLKSAPKQADEGAPSAWLVLTPEVGAGLQGIAVGDEIVLITWLDRADRNLLSVHARGDTSKTQQGVFSTRSPHRPNPIGLHEVTITAVDGLRLQVRGLEALDGTPIIDLKPVLDSDIGKR